MKNFVRHARVLIFRGVLATIPLVLALLTLQFIYVFIDSRVMNLVDRFIGFRIPGLGILLILVFLYFVGFMVSNVLGKSLLKILDAVFNRIPILKSAYQVGKQLSSTIELTEKQVFQKAVLVNVFQQGFWAVGFVTGTVKNHKNPNEQYLKIFIPNVPNPTSGFVFVMKESQTIDPKWTVDEALKIIISGGIIGPEEMNKP